MEQFRKIDGFPNYSISEYGNVRNDVKGLILKPRLVTAGYLSVNLPGTKQKSIHRLVATAFCENPNNCPEVDHIDRNKKNNHFSNLRWITRSDNNRNRKKKTDCTSRFQGVYFEKRRNRWTAHVRIDGKHKHIGYFDTELEAAEAFRKAIVENHLEDFYPEDCVTSPN